MQQETYSVGVKRGGHSSWVHLGAFGSLQLTREFVEADSRGRGRQALPYNDGPDEGQWIMHASDDSYLIERQHTTEMS